MEVLFSIEGLVSLLTLTFLEIVLGIDNIIFISIISGRLPLATTRKGPEYRYHTGAAGPYSHVVRR